MDRRTSSPRDHKHIAKYWFYYWFHLKPIIQDLDLVTFLHFYKNVKFSKGLRWGLMWGLISPKLNRPLHNHTPTLGEGCPHSHALGILVEFTLLLYSRRKHRVMLLVSINTCSCYSSCVQFSSFFKRVFWRHLPPENHLRANLTYSCTCTSRILKKA